MEAFERIRQHPAEQHPAPPTPPQQVEFVYTERHEELFRGRTEKLTLDALSSSYVMKTRSRVIEITVPTESAEDLIAEALEGWPE